MGATRLARISKPPRLGRPESNRAKIRAAIEQLGINTSDLAIARRVGRLLHYRGHKDEHGRRIRAWIPCEEYEVRREKLKMYREQLPAGRRDATPPEAFDWV